MKEHPIIFSTDMAKAILDGRKSMTRRVLRVQPHIFDDWASPKTWVWKHIAGLRPYLAKELAKHCPYGQVGDRLWVRETFCEHTTGGVIYRADEQPCEGVYSYHKWRPSIYMPRWASRITLEITEVRVERLQEITEEDAEAEGMTGRLYQQVTGSLLTCSRDVFQWYWDSLDAKRGYGWDKNPWVWVITFKVVSK